MDKNKIKVALLGLGRIGQMHAKNLIENREFKLKYVPDKLCVELKSLKLYMGSYREIGAFHEDVTNQIFQDLFSLIKPRFMSLDAHWKVRGGITTYVEVKKTKTGWKNKNNY